MAVAWLSGRTGDGARRGELRGMTVIVNGERRDVATDTTLGVLIAELGIRRDGIAVARNDDVVARGSIDDTLLCEGDTVEIIVAVAGG